MDTAWKSICERRKWKLPLESWPRAKVLNIYERKNLTIVFLNWPRVGIFAVQGETYLDVFIQAKCHLRVKSIRLKFTLTLAVGELFSVVWFELNHQSIVAIICHNDELTWVQLSGNPWLFSCFHFGRFKNVLKF